MRSNSLIRRLVILCIHLLDCLPNSWYVILHPFVYRDGEFLTNILGNYQGHNHNHNHNPLPP